MNKRHFLLPLGFLLCCTDLWFLPMIDDTVSMTPENCLLCLTYFFPFDLTFTCNACPIMKAYSCKVSFKNLSFAEGHVALWEGDIFPASCPYPIILLWCSRVDHLLFLFQISYAIELLTFKCLLRLKFHPGFQLSLQQRYPPCSSPMIDHTLEDSSCCLIFRFSLETNLGSWLYGTLFSQILTVQVKNRKTV